MTDIFLGLAAFCYGIASAAGVFTALAATGLIPRFTGKTHTAKYTMWYETVVVLGTIVGLLCSVYARYVQLYLTGISSLALQLLYGICSGMYVGCLALAIAEILGSIPVFARRIGFRQGIGVAIMGIALGKLTGSLLYFGYLKNLF